MFVGMLRVVRVVHYGALCSVLPFPLLIFLPAHALLARIPDLRSSRKQKPHQVH